MAYDLQGERLCDHRTVEELYVADLDRRSIYIERPIANTEVDLRMNGYKIPKNHKRLGWQLVDNEFTIHPDKRLKILFNQPLRALDDFFEVTYYTQDIHCRKCHGQKIVRDIIFSPNGRPRYVRDEQKLIQAVLKGVLSIVGTNIFHNWYGTKLYPYIGSATRNENYIANNIKAEVLSFCKTLKELQEHQMQYQDVTLRELLQDVNSVNVYRNPELPNVWFVDILATTKAGTIITITRDISLPSLTDLDYKRSKKDVFQ